MTQEKVFETIIQHTVEVIPELEKHSCKLEDKLVDLGANSMDRAEIVSMTMESYSLQIPRVDLASASNIGELAGLVAERL